MIYLDLFLTFFKIGAFTFGGGYAMLPLIQQEVAAHSWMSMEELVNFVAVSESTPGPFAVNVSTYVGMVTGGVPGAFCATFGVVLPSFLIILLVARCFAAFGNNRIVKGCMAGLKPAVVGLIGAAAVSIGQTVFFSEGISGAVFSDGEFYVSLVIFGAGLWMAFKKVHPVCIIGISAAAGIVSGYVFQMI